MKLSLRRPVGATVTAFLVRSTGKFTYAEVGATKHGADVPGYDNDRRRVKLGEGEAAFEAAKAALRRWAQFPPAWTFVSRRAPLEAGQTVAMCARAFGVWWINAARIVYAIDEPRRFGFAYGTLAAHVECGEERFLIEWAEDGSVWYDLRAFSRPRRLLIRLGYPLARRLQKRFARDSGAALVAELHRE